MEDLKQHDGNVKDESVLPLLETVQVDRPNSCGNVAETESTPPTCIGGDLNLTADASRESGDYQGLPYTTEVIPSGMTAHQWKVVVRRERKAIRREEFM